MLANAYMAQGEYHTARHCSEEAVRLAQRGVEPLSGNRRLASVKKKDIALFRIIGDINILYQFTIINAAPLETVGHWTDSLCGNDSKACLLEHRPEFMNIVLFFVVGVGKFIG
jgi:hypothetical protein